MGAHLTLGGRGAAARLVVAASVVALAVPLVVPADAVTSHAACAIVARSGPWQVIDVPFQTKTTNAWAVDPIDPESLWATDGAVVKRSTDGGCTWRTVFDVATNLSAGAEPLLVSPVVATIVVARHASTTEVYLGVTSASDIIDIAVSSNQGATWRTAPLQTSAAPSSPSAWGLGSAVLLAAAPSDPKTIYAATNGAGAAQECDENYGAGLGVPSVSDPGCLDQYPRDPTESLYVSHDAGKTWAVVAATGLVNGFFLNVSDATSSWEVSSLAVSSADSRTLLATWVGPGTNSGHHDPMHVYRSANGGASFAHTLRTGYYTAETFDPPFVSFDRDGSTKRVVARTCAGIYVSTDNGATWKQAAPPPIAGKAAHVESATPFGDGRVAVLSGAAPFSIDTPPFGAQALSFYSIRTHSWSSAPAPPIPGYAVDYGESLGVSGPASHPVLSWAFHSQSYLVSAILRYDPDMPQQSPRVWSAYAGKAPPSRYNATTAYDAATRQVVLFGGYSSSASGFLGDTWTWNGAAWTQRTGPAPPARQNGTMAYDPATRRVVLFGGNGTSALLGDTWTWDGASWKQHTSGPQPAARSHASLVYDEARRNLVLFGGGGSNGDLSDTWTWNGGVWSQHTTGTAPAGRNESATAYDPATKQVVMFGGSESGAPASDTWIWNGSIWSPVSGTAPPARSLAAIVYDAARKSLVLFGGSGASGLRDTWTWGGGRWTRRADLSAPPQSWPLMAYDARSRHVLLVANAGVVNTWSWDGQRWVAQPNAGPPLRSLEAVSIDSRGRPMLFGGTGFGGFLADTWTYTG